ncbi:MAG: cysteine desulfurase [Bdellovibrionales bacterium]|nr:cysteine desulfurase [Bdellovibrionales bacterium]
MNRPIYLDYNATTPTDPEVLEAMLPYFKEAFGNASSNSHSYGWEASQAVETARKQVSELIEAKPKNIVWTSGATESNNLALFSIIRPYLKRGEPVHLITTLIEHKAVLDVARELESEGCLVTYLKPDQFGQISAESVAQAITPHTKLVSIIMGQNEIGTLNPIKEIGQFTKSKNILFHVDAAQALGKTLISVDEMNIDLLSASGHKIYAPKGIGFLYVRDQIQLEPMLFGGAQECGLRPGTLNVPGIVAFGKACEICTQNMSTEILRLTKLRDQFIEKVESAVSSAKLNGHRTARLYSNASFSFEGLSADVFALGLSGLAVSSGSACSQGAPSHVLEAIGLPPALARATVRFGIGRFTTEAELDTAASKIIKMIEKNKALSI